MQYLAFPGQERPTLKPLESTDAQLVTVYTVLFKLQSTSFVTSIFFIFLYQWFGTYKPRYERE